MLRCMAWTGIRVVALGVIIAGCRGGASKRSDGDRRAGSATGTVASDATVHASVSGDGGADAAGDAAPDSSVAGPVVLLQEPAAEATIIGRYLYYHDANDRLRRVPVEGGDSEAVMPELGRIGTIAGASDGSVVVSARSDKHWRIVRLRDGKVEDVGEDDRNWVGSIVATKDTVWWHANDPLHGDHVRGVGPGLDVTSPIAEPPGGGTGAGQRSNLVLHDSYVYWIANQRLWRLAQAGDSPAEEVLTVDGYRLVASRATLFAAAQDGIIKIDLESGKTGYLDRYREVAGLAANAAWIAYVANRWPPGRPPDSPRLVDMTAEVHLVRRGTGTGQVVFTQQEAELDVLIGDRYLYVLSRGQVLRLALPAR